jgi:hypothetical protein
MNRRLCPLRIKIVVAMVAILKNKAENINLPPVRCSDRESSRRFLRSHRVMNSGKGFHNSRRGVGGNINVAVGATDYATRCVRRVRPRSSEM